MKLHQHPLRKQDSSFVLWLSFREAEGLYNRDQINETIKAWLKTWKDAGLPNNPDLDEMSLAVFKQVYHAKKLKAIELCPALEHEISTFDTKQSPFWQHPLNREIHEFQNWLFHQCYEKGYCISLFDNILFDAYKPFRDTHIPRGPEVTEQTVEAFKVQLRILKERTIETFPDLAGEMRSIGNGHWRE